MRFDGSAICCPISSSMRGFELRLQRVVFSENAEDKQMRVFHCGGTGGMSHGVLITKCCVALRCIGRAI
jgi:hypothetical protein